MIIICNSCDRKIEAEHACPHCGARNPVPVYETKREQKEEKE